MSANTCRLRHLDCRLFIKGRRHEEAAWQKVDENMLDKIDPHPF